MPTQFDSDFGKLKEKLLQMGALAERMIRDISSALIDRKMDLLARVYENEEEMDCLQNDLDEETVRMIGVYTPVAGDLRLLLMVTRINAEIERVGDKVVDIGHILEDFLQEKPVKSMADFTHAADLAENMLRNALNAFVNNSVEEAMSVIAADDKVDRLTDQTTRALFTYMLDDAHVIGSVFALLLVAQALERIADHAVNICEDVVYIVQGKDIRHLRGRELNDSDKQSDTASAENP